MTNSPVAQFIKEHSDSANSYGDFNATILDAFKVEVSQDLDYQNPFDDRDEPATFGIDMSNHRNWRGGEFGEKAPFDVSDFIRWYKTGECAPEDKAEFSMFVKTHHWTFVYLLSHSGTTVNTTGFSCPWDSGIAGIAFVSKKDAISESLMSIKKSWSAQKRDEAIQEYLKISVGNVDDYINGNCYQINVTNITKDEEVSCCGGFWGDEGREHAINEALSTVYYELKHEKQAA